MSKLNREIQTSFSDDDNPPPPPPPPPPKKEPPNDTPPPNPQPDKPPPGSADIEAIPEPRVRPSRYITTTEDDKDSGFETIAVYLSLFFVIITFPLSIFLCLIVVKEYHRMLIFRLGRVRKGVRGPGLVWTLPCIDSFVKVDLRTFATEVPSQDILTRDSVTISVDAVLYYCIKDPMDALIQVDDAKEATVLIAQTTLRHIVGAKPLHTLLTSRETLSKEIQLAVDEITERWGVRVERVDVMDISLPYTLQRSLASEAEAVREARAKIISAEGELNASQALKEASDVMSQNKITLQLRHLQILTSIAAERRCSIIYPFPMEIMTPFMDSGGGGGGRSRGGTGGDPGGKRRDSILTNFFFGKPEADSSSNSSPMEPKSDVASDQAESEQDPNNSSDTRGGETHASEMPGGSRAPQQERPLALAFMDILSYQQFLQNRR
ncbi:stomatin isoform X2 [Drosophila obscura]|uniref:stomatin isoform X2 n=1 Tax=Drosophila obscura TaxID=7282 RepID=UPI001BB184C5|nr:stomatin isoform X2 [Drosophila obscura]